MKYIYNLKDQAFVNPDTYQHPSYGDYKILQTAIAFSLAKDIQDENLPFDYIGDWNQDIFEKSCDIYWLVVDKTPVEIVLINDFGRKAYIMNFGGKMVTCTPDEGDIIYSMKEEADDEIEEELEKEKDM